MSCSVGDRVTLVNSAIHFAGEVIANPSSTTYYVMWDDRGQICRWHHEDELELERQEMTKFKIGDRVMLTPDRDSAVVGTIWTKSGDYYLVNWDGDGQGYYNDHEIVHAVEADDEIDPYEAKIALLETAIGWELPVCFEYNDKTRDGIAVKLEEYDSYDNVLVVGGDGEGVKSFHVEKINFLSVGDLS